MTSGTQEKFAVHAPTVAGYGLLCAEVFDQIGRESDYVRAHAGAGDGFDGLIMSALRGPVNEYASFMSRVMPDDYLKRAAKELKHAAWLYVHADRSNYEIISDIDENGNPCNPKVVDYAPFPDPEPFPVSSDPTATLVAPDLTPPDIKHLVDEVGGVLKTVDGICRTLFGWSPVDAIVEPVSGNWNALSAAGEALIIAGDALDESLANLTKSLPRLDAQWDGGAAQEFMTYLGRLVEGEDQYAALNRVVGEVYKLVAAQIEKVAKLLVGALGDVAKQLTTLKLYDFVPWGKAISLIKAAFHLFEAAKKAADQLDRIKEDAITLIEIARDPVAAARAGIQNKVEEQLKPLEEGVEKGVEYARLATDLAELAKVDDWENQPDSDYQLGSDPERPGA